MFEFLTHPSSSSNYLGDDYEDDFDYICDCRNPSQYITYIYSAVGMKVKTWDSVLQMEVFGTVCARPRKVGTYYKYTYFILGYYGVLHTTEFNPEQLIEIIK